MQSFPLQHKKLQRLTVPYLRVGTSEVMNMAPQCMMDSFHAFNGKNTSVYADSAAHTLVGGSSRTPVPFMGQLVAGGLIDSYTGSAVSRFVATYLSRALSMHTVDSAELRALRREFPDDPLVDLMSASMQRHRTLQLPHLRGRTDEGPLRSLRSVVSDADMQQYAISTDAAFFKACDIMSTARRHSLAEGDDMGGRRGEGDGARRADALRLTPYERRIAEELAAALKDASGVCGGDKGSGKGSSSSTTAPAPSEADVVADAKSSGCRAVWFAATVVPSDLEWRRRLALGEDGRGEGAAPPPRKTLADPTLLERRELTALEAVARAQAFSLEVLVSNVGDARAFGLARHPLTAGSRSLLDPTRERVVPLSIDHRPFRQEEFHRITQAGGRVDSAAGEVIDGNPYYNVSRSFGHWRMKSDPRRSPVQQKLSAVPHTATWRMLAGDVLVLANHAVFQTRREDDSSLDEVARLVGRELDRGASPEQAAAAVCDFAIRFGAPHSLQVMVAVATAETAGAAVGSPSAGKDVSPVQFEEWLEPGPLYVEACRHIPALRDAFLRDCTRCGVTPAEMIGKRWERVRDLLPQRHALPLMPFYGRECGALQQVMDEEADFFDLDALRPPPAGSTGPAPSVSSPEVQSALAKLARGLLGGKP